MQKSKSLSFLSCCCIVKTTTTTAAAARHIEKQKINQEDKKFEAGSSNEDEAGSSNEDEAGSSNEDYYYNDDDNSVGSGVHVKKLPSPREIR